MQRNSISARRRKKLAKALERQARKLRAKGIAVDLDALKSEYLAQHRAHNSDSEIDDDDQPIDVVGGADSSDEPEDCSMTRRDSVDALSSTTGSRGGSDAGTGLGGSLGDNESTPNNKNSMRTNPFSIESLLYNNT